MNGVGTTLNWTSALLREAEPPPRCEAIPGFPSHRGFIAMSAACRATGGVARADDLARLLEDHRFGDNTSLSSLIRTGEIFGFAWQQGFWVPMFQFELRDLSSKSAPRQVRDELATAFDGWPLAVWFAEFNVWLSERRPVDLLDSNLAEVLAAARADRFIAAG